MDSPTQPPDAKQRLRLLTLALPILLLLAAACKDDPAEKPESYPIVLYGESVEATTDVRMFTAGGEITDPQKISKYTANWHYFEGSEDGIGEKMLTFMSASEANIRIDRENDYQLAFSVERDGDQFRFISEAEILAPDDRFHRALRSITKHAHPISTYPTATGLEFRTKQLITAQGTPKHLVFPAVVFQMSFGDIVLDNYYYMMNGVLYNEFNEEGIAGLGANDTLAVRTFRVHAKAR